MSHVYLTGSWTLYTRNTIKTPIENALIKNNIPMYNNLQLFGMTLQDNSVEIIKNAIGNCSCYVAVLDDKEYRYAGTLELMAIAASLNKKILLYIPVDTDPGTQNGDQRWREYRTQFDRVWIYHPNVTRFNATQRDEFIKAIVETHQAYEKVPISEESSVANESDVNEIKEALKVANGGIIQNLQLTQLLVNYFNQKELQAQGKLPPQPTTENVTGRSESVEQPDNTQQPNDTQQVDKLKQKNNIQRAEPSDEHVRAILEKYKTVD